MPTSCTDTDARLDLIAARNKLMTAITALRGGYATVMDDCDEAIAALDLAIGHAFMTSRNTAGTAGHENKKYSC